MLEQILIFRIKMGIRHFMMRYWEWMRRQRFC